MTATIVLSTYNGEKFITEQLDSLRLQTRPADEVLISDDCSTDSTPQIVKDYIQKYKLTGWIFKQNEKNAGWKKNFYKLLQEAGCDLIFLCDQDDIWHRQKLELMIPAFENQNINVLCCRQLRRKDGKLSFSNKKINKVGLHHRKFSENFSYINRPGCTYAVRREWFKSIEPWWKDTMPHDALLFRNAMLDDSLYFMQKGLIIRRIHENNASIGKGKAKYQIYLPYYDEVCNLLEDRVKNDSRIEKAQKKLKKINKVRQWTKARSRMYEKTGLINYLRLCRYYRCYVHIVAFIKEIKIIKAMKSVK